MTEVTSSSRFASVALTDVGKVRKLNEDAFLDDPAAGLWLVADGVGGHARGDYASQLTVATLAKIGPQESAAALLAAVKDGLSLVNENLLAFAANEHVDIVATTVVALLCFGQHYAVLWAGDSRLYLLRGGQLYTVTRDHTAVQEMVDEGIITAEQALHHPRRNVITRAVGITGTLVLDMAKDRIEPGDLFLLCTDGLTKVMEDEEIARALVERGGAGAPAYFIAKAIERGAPDNVTVVTVACPRLDV
ncbi:MAG TPA: protein phosphatase 2C domain-containing protein [Stellaceae bacterium]|jgi:serine/threonine protein phosphatase PrpC|nr:protein phosphatase 2C domain-containing protein [Stellaceae bacterium]